MAKPLCALVLALVLGLLASANGVRAYSTTSHERLTAHAVELHERCRALAGAAPRSQPLPAKIVAYYNTRQDDWLSKSGLWHFPTTAPSEHCPGPFPVCQLVIERSYERWTDDIWRRVAEALPAGQLYPALGAALHYVQDLAVPAHAVPVFHPRSWLDPSDGFDDYAQWDGADSRPSEQALGGECARLSALAQVGSLAALLARMRDETQQSLSEPFSVSRAGSPVTLSFALLWRARGAGFGVYGCEGEFGDEQLRCDGVRYQVAAATYQAFAGRRARSAILYSAATIALFEQKLAPCRGQSCTPTEHETAWLPTRCRIGELSRASQKK